MQTTANVRHNIIANFAARAWSALMTLAFLPLYIRFLGIEAYGLIGVYVSLVALLAVLDMGLSTTLTRELARLSAAPGGEQEARDLTRTFELIYWGVGILIGGGVAMMAPVIARHWLNVEGLAIETVEQSAMIMGLAVALQWPNSLYSGGLMGLQRQVLMNIVRAGAATLQGGGAVLVLWLVSPTIVAYFSWQIVAGALQTVVMAACLWRSLPSAANHAAFRRQLLERNWRFAGGITGIIILSILLTQTDKIILSKLLSLEMFGYYALAAAIAGGMNYISSPIFTALFPRLSQAAAGGSNVEITRLYHQGTQLMTAVVAPVWIILALFSEELLTLWFGDSRTASNIHLLVTLLLTGTALNSIMSLPFALQLAYGWTRLMLYVNSISLTVFVPLLIWLVNGYGAVGAALAWISINAGYILVVVPLMHRRLLKESMGEWYLRDVGLPVALCLGIGLVVRFAIPVGLQPYAVLLWVISAFALCFLSALLAMSHTRAWVWQLVFPSANAGTNP